MVKTETACRCLACDPVSGEIGLECVAYKKTQRTRHAKKTVQEVVLLCQGGRYTPKRKIAILGLLADKSADFDEICALFGLSPEELISWQNRFKKHRSEGLKVTKIQRLR